MQDDITRRRFLQTAAWLGLGQADAEKDPLEEMTPGEEQ